MWIRLNNQHQPVKRADAVVAEQEWVPAAGRQDPVDGWETKTKQEEV